MSNIKDLLPQDSLTVQAIYDHYKKTGDSQKERCYLGASIIGEPCERLLWYSFRLCFSSDFSGRLYRLFDTGFKEEPRVEADLRAIGCEVFTHDEDGEQFGCMALGGHFRGHADGVVVGVPEAPKTPHLLEIKTHNAKSYKDLIEKGVQKSKPKHYSQMMVYMGLMKLTRSLYFAKNKDTEDLFTDRIESNANEFKRIMDKAERVIRAATPPDRCATRPDTFACKFCDAYKLCWGTGDTAVPIPKKTCRTCCHATPEIDEGEDWARWSCSKIKEDVSFDDQLKACDAHLLIPDLISFAISTDAGDEWIEFTNKTDGAKWVHGNEPESWATDELLRTPGPMVGQKAIALVKSGLKAEVVEVQQAPFDDNSRNLVDCYPTEDSELIWDMDHIDNDIIEEAVETALMIPGGESLPDPSATFEDEDYIAVEYDGRVLLVIYKEAECVAIWGGKI